DGTVGSRDVTWAIGRATIASVPSQSGSLTYTGEEQTPAFEGYNAAQMAIAGAQAGTNAGTYKVQFTPDENHQWPDGSTEAKEVSWTIAPAAGSITLDKSSLELRASLMSGVITVTRPGDGAITATSGNTSIATVSVDGNEVTVTAKAKGSVNITVAVGAGANYTAPQSKTVS
ncbi:Ig-like domain-containing protein, partial [Acutalibacter caecimuris]|uniref:Ig-like domain-containing protein n=1 Tax=Acutalibacter caecimuris TaxID=3093657 RepID=UPI002AC8F0BD